MDTTTKVQEPQILTEEEYRELFPEVKEKGVRFTRDSILDAFGEAFYSLGGVPGLAVWAAQNGANRGKFYSMLARLGASNQTNILNSNGPLIIRPALPPSPLDE